MSGWSSPRAPGPPHPARAGTAEALQPCMSGRWSALQLLEPATSRQAIIIPSRGVEPCIGPERRAATGHRWRGASPSPAHAHLRKGRGVRPVSGAAVEPVRMQPAPTWRRSPCDAGGENFSGAKKFGGEVQTAAKEIRPKGEFRYKGVFRVKRFTLAQSPKRNYKFESCNYTSESQPRAYIFISTLYAGFYISGCFRRTPARPAEKSACVGFI